MKKTQLIPADNPQILKERVLLMVAKGWDLLQPPFITSDGKLAQYIFEGAALYEYELVHAEDLDIFNEAVSGLIEQGWDFLWDTKIWRGEYVQWMLRWKTGFPASLSASAMSLTADAAQAGALSMIEQVQPILHWKPTDGKVIPFPLIN